MKQHRETLIGINGTEFKKVGHRLIDDIAKFIDSIKEKPVTLNESPKELQTLLGQSELPNKGMDTETLMSKTSNLLMNHSLLNGHPKFMGYITSSAAPIGALADLLAASINPNCGAQTLSPIATEIERQTIKWLTEFIGLSPNYGGIMVSGGNMANFTAFLAARTEKGSKDIKENGLINSKMLVYCSKATHTWVEKATILFGLGTNAIRWIETTPENIMDNSILDNQIKEDLKNGFKPIMVVGTAGDVSTGVVDDLSGIASICKKHDLWFHVDGAYGVPAAVVPEYKELFDGLKEADSIALDPHKWLYSPLEAGCTLVKNPQHLINTYSSHPEYYNFGTDDEGLTINFYEYGLQNSRGFRALKVWLALQQVGKQGYIKLINEDIDLSKLLFDLATRHPELEAVTQNLSITTLRYVPLNHPSKKDDELNTLNEALLNTIQKNGKAYLSNAIVNGKYCLRSCIVNFRTSRKDIEETITIIVEEGRKMC